jgi:uncharacterized membrane protein YfcA
MWFHSLLVLVAAMAAGAVNAVAGGGTLLTFPALLATGQTALIANATSTAALWPGSVSSLWGYRREISGTRDILVPLVLLGLVGGFCGAILLLITPTKAFDRIIPFLILGATLLLLAQEPISRWIRARAEQAPAAEGAEALPDKPARLTPPMFLLMFVTAIYGGYFGAGIGIITLAALSLIGMRNIHQMNGIKNVYALCANGVAATVFVSKGLVDWRLAGLMALGSIFGGYAGAGIARRIGQKNVRRIIIAIGFLMTISLLRHW